MGHAINNDTDLMIVVNEDRREPWHRLGHYVNEAQTAEAALDLAGLNWTVKLVPVFAFIGDLEGEHAVTDADLSLITQKFAVVAVNPDGSVKEVLGVVGSRFTGVPNCDLFAFMDGIVGNIGGAHYDTAGYIRPMRKDGTQMAQVFLTIDLADAGEIVLDPNGAADKLTSKLYCTAGHDGSMSIISGLSTVRILCANTQQFALGSSQAKFKMKHTANINQRMDQAREALGIALAGIDQLHATAEHLIVQSHTDKEFAAMIDKVFPAPADDAATATKNRHEVARDSMIWLRAKAPTNENIRGTKWASYQAVAEYLDWSKPVKGATTEKKLVARATQAVTGSNDAKKLRTLQLLSA